MRLRDLKSGGHAPSLFSAFLHFDISFMVWVILGALMPFITTDPALTGQNLRVTPTTDIQRTGQYTLLIRGPQTVHDNPKLKADQPKNVYNLIIKPGDPATATRAYGVSPTVQSRVDAAARPHHAEAPGWITKVSRLRSGRTGALGDACGTGRRARRRSCRRRV